MATTPTDTPAAGTPGTEASAAGAAAAGASGASATAAGTPATTATANAATTARTDHTRAVSSGGHGHGPQSLTPRAGASRADRLTSFHLADFPVPTGREEEWRFTPVRQLAPLFEAGLADDGVRADIQAAPGVRVEQVAPGDPRLGLTPPPGDRIAAAAWESLRSATVITLTSATGAADAGAGQAGAAQRADLVAGDVPPSGAEAARGDVASAAPGESAPSAAEGAFGDLPPSPDPAQAGPGFTPGAPAPVARPGAVDFGHGVSVVRLTGVTATPSAGHIVVIAEPNARGTVVLDHTGLAVHAQNVELVLGEGAHVELVTVQDWEPGAIHASAHRARVGKDAYLKHVAITLGGSLVRLTPEATFSGQGGEVELLGLYLTDTGQHHEHRLFVDHDLPRCRSRVTYKGALQGETAHAVWIGDVLIRAAAEGTDTYEQNRNLVLTDGARADSVPNLEIETGEIEGAGHASATGRFDDEQLFYLMARGIPEATARRLVVHGFFADLVQRIGVPALETRLMAAIDAELAKSLSADDDAADADGPAGAGRGAADAAGDVTITASGEANAAGAARAAGPAGAARAAGRAGSGERA